MTSFRISAVARVMIDFALRLRASFLTYIRGVALPNEKPLFRVKPYHVIAIAASKLIFSILGTTAILGLNTPLALPLLVLTQIMGQSAIQTAHMIAHHGVHDALTLNKKHKWVNRWVTEIASTLALTLPYQRYRKSHGFHHVPKKLASVADPDHRYLVNSLGFIEGQPVEFYWRRLVLTLLNPAYYWVLLTKRLRANFIKAEPYRRGMSILWWSLVLMVTVLTQSWLVTLLGYLVPVVIGYGISNLTQLLTEHRWGYEEDPAYKTYPRLLPINDPSTPFWKKVAYWYWRETVLVTDLQQHQVHHYRPKNVDWPMIAYSQEAQKDLPHAIYGIRNHFREAFMSLSKAREKS